MSRLIGCAAVEALALPTVRLADHTEPHTPTRARGDGVDGKTFTNDDFEKEVENLRRFARERSDVVKKAVAAARQQ